MRLLDTLSRTKREFTPVNKVVQMYVCGITPYAPCHVGHAMSFVVFDILRRYLEYLGYHVNHVQNFTDIDDKLIARAKLDGVTVQELAERNIEEYFTNLDLLGVLRAQVYPRATQEIPSMLEIIRRLVERGYAYAANGDVYFRVLRAQNYGKLSHRTLDGMIAGARVETVAHKEHPMDFTLWKGAKEGEPSWDSPWGPGRPGWHIECSAMALGYLGTQVDIHGGGHDLIFPHHENEIAQSEAYTGELPFARFWVHNGLISLAQEKMSKSVGNIVAVRDALMDYSPNALRLFFLGSHYRSPLTYTNEGMAAAERAMERLLYAAMKESDGQGLPVDGEPYKKLFLDAMDDDLNTPQAIAAMFDLSRDINRSREEKRNVTAAQGVLKEIGNILGLTFCEQHVTLSVEPHHLIELLMEVRSELRTAKQFGLADRIRKRLAEMGVTLTDTDSGTEWKSKHRELGSDNNLNLSEHIPPSSDNDL